MGVVADLITYTDSTHLPYTDQLFCYLCQNLPYLPEEPPAEQK